MLLGCQVVPSGYELAPADCQVVPSGCELAPADCQVVPSGFELAPAGYSEDCQSFRAIESVCQPVVKTSNKILSRVRYENKCGCRTSDP